MTFKQILPVVLFSVAVAVAQVSCGTSTSNNGGTTTGGTTGGSCVTPAAAPAAKAAPACTTSMYAKYGADGFNQVLNNIGALATSKSLVPQLGDTFQTLIVAASQARQTQFNTNLSDFIIQVYGGPQQYTGPTIVLAHASLQITSAQFDAFISDVVVPALTQAGVTSSDITDCFAPPLTDPNFKGQVVTCQ